MARTAFPRHIATFATLIGFALLALAAQPILAQFSISLGTNGTITYNRSTTMVTCTYDEVHHLTTTYDRFTYNTFVFHASNAQTTSLPWTFTQISGSPGRSSTSLCPNDSTGTTHSLFVGGNFVTAFELYVVLNYSALLGQNFTGTYFAGATGYINPKYVVVTVFYAPPGSKSNVNYTKSTVVSNTSSITTTFTSSTTQTVNFTTGGLFGMLGGSQTTETQSNTLTESTQDMRSATIALNTSQGFIIPGPQSDYIGVNHDFDIIRVWINPVLTFAVFNVNTTSFPGAIDVAWLGYGSSSLDTVAPIDLVDIPVGCLNGDSPASASACSTPLGAFQRTWAANENWPSGEGPGLTQTDLDSILAADPFGKCLPTSAVGSSNCPVPSAQFTIPPEFAIASINGVSTDFEYGQPLPGDNPSSNTYATAATNSTVQSQQSTQMYSQTYGIEDAFIGGGFLKEFSANETMSQTLTWSYQTNDQITKSSTSSVTALITGPACVGNPCNPTYPPTSLTYGTGTFFDVYQDNFFGTFLFVPVRYN